MLKRGMFIVLLIISIVLTILMFNIRSINPEYPDYEIKYERLAMLLPAAVIAWRALSVKAMKERKMKK